MKTFYQNPNRQYDQQVLAALNLPADYRLAHIGVSSCYPSGIINHIQQLKDTVDGIVLHNGDVWRYSDSAELQEWIRSDSREYFIFTSGYHNQQIIPRMYELSMPLWYYERTVAPLQIKFHGLSYGFSCLNNSANLPRLALGCSLYNQKLLDQIIFSQNVVGLPLAPYSQVLADKLPNITDYVNLLPITWVHEAPSDNFGGDHSVSHDAYQHSYCNIVTETETENFTHTRIFPTPVITEKSYKPFTSCQIPVWLAAQGHMAYLQGLGFEVMEDLLPLGYDNMNTFDKITAITNLVAKGREYIEDYYFTHLREIQHNHELVSSDQVEQLILNRIRNFLI
jgi:hypothetical protein